MSFWKKLFGGEAEDEAFNADVAFENTKKDLAKLGLSTKADLIGLLKPLIRPCTAINVQTASSPPENSQLRSHFGGQPYFEKGSEWPKTKSGNHLDFVCQIFNKEDFELPNSIQLIQFFYNWEDSPWETANEGWVLKIHKKLNHQDLITIAPPSKLEKQKYCEIEFQPNNSLPDFESLSTYNANAEKLCQLLDWDNEWEYYDQINRELLGEDTETDSRLGGYPNWVQGEEIPLDSKGNPTKFLFQIDSEDNADIMWGDVGIVYFFYDEVSEKIEFILQCH